MTTDDKQTPDPTTPALLSAARLDAAIVEAIVADLSDRRGLRHEWQAIDDDIREEIKATWIGIVGRHLAALTPPAVPDGGEALGQMLHQKLEIDTHCTSFVWSDLSEENQERHTSAGLALHAIGYAAGRASCCVSVDPATLTVLSTDAMDPLYRLRVEVEHPEEPAGLQGLVTILEENLTSRSPTAQVTRVRNAIDLTQEQAVWLHGALGRVVKPAWSPDDGRALYYALHPTAHERAWENHDADLRARYEGQAAALVAAGRSEGEAERTQMASNLAGATRAAKVNGEELIKACDEIADRDAEIARLTAERDTLAAELAEARTRIEQGIVGVAIMKEAHAEALAAARRDGAREEREAIRDKVDHDARFGADSARGPMLAIVDWLDSRARGEGQGS